MNKGSLFTSLLIVAALLAGVPTALFYYYDSKRITQLGNMESKIAWAENQKERSLIKDQVQQKLDTLSGSLSVLDPAALEAKYAAVTSNYTIKNTGYTKEADKKKIRAQFLGAVKKADANAQAALLLRNGSVLEATNPELKKLQVRGNTSLGTKFLQSLPSGKAISEVNLKNGAMEMFLPVVDAKGRVVSVVYVREDISSALNAARQVKQSKSGYTFLADSNGRVVLSTDTAKEENENLMVNPDIKSVYSGSAAEENIREAEYSNLKGMLGFKKVENTDYTLFIFTPNIDYPALSEKKARSYTSALFDTDFILPAYAVIAAAFILGLIIIIPLSSAPYSPLSKIVKALKKVDEEGFENFLPKIKEENFKKIIDAILILRGRVKASEENAEKLSQMSKELEEELSREASRADREISELRDSMKIAESAKASAEEEVSKLKAEAEKAKRESQAALSAEKNALAEKEAKLNKEIEALKAELKKEKESSVPAEKENMRMESVLMMNTELKGVLSVIKTYISSVLGGEGKITDAQQQFLGVVINKSARLERLINDLTELAKLEKGEIRLARSAVEINGAVQDLIFSIQPQADIKKVELKVNLKQQLPLCYGDPAKVTALVSQLLNQAIKVSPRGGQVIVESKEAKEGVEVRISDFGMSLPPAKSGALFVNFHGPESPAGPEFVNTGLRFPILKATAKNMGGDLNIESEIGKGKTFIITLSGKAGEGAAAAPAARQEKPFVLSAQPPAQKERSAPAAAAPSQEKAKEEKAAPKPDLNAYKPKPFNSLPELNAESASAAPAAEIKKEPAPGGFKIQRNSFEAPAPPAKKEEQKQEILTVTDLLGSKPEAPKQPDMKLPGVNTEVPPSLAEAPKKSEAKEIKLPDELPPLPDLVDDKGSDTI